VNYFAQLSPLYELFGVEMPLVVERSHFQITTPRVRNLLEMLELAVSDLAQPRDVLVKKLAKDSPNAPRLEWGAELGRRLEALVANSAESDSSIVKEAVRLRESMRHGLDRLTTRYDRAVVERDHVLTTRLSRLQGWLYPEGHPQERVFSFPAFAARVGLESFHRYVMAAVDPFSSAMREIAL